MMNRLTRFGTAISTIALAATLSSCAADRSRESIFGHKIDRANIGLATRAQAALAAEQFANAIDLAERAVENSPSDAGFRALLGNCYFAGGRFASAEQAYRDSLALFPRQPQVILKLALVQIAQGENSQALAALEAARAALEPADYGLAVALAGRPADAVAVLNDAARGADADGRVRQNLALAYGLSGDWTTARTIAAQDVPPDQLDGRIQQWMAMATPSHPFDQVAALTGVRPAADPGQPQRLALKDAPNNVAFAEAIAPQPQPQQIAAIPASAPVALPEPVAAELPPAAVAQAARSLIAPAEQPVVNQAALPELPTRFEAPAQPASYVAITDTVRRAAKRERHAAGRSKSVVQLGAYSSPERVSSAWTNLIRRYPALASYTPMRARFDGPRGTVWRLSIKGFGSDREARERCDQLQSRGGNCFVRTMAGDAPVQMASR